MKKLTQTLFIVFFGLSAVAQHPGTKLHRPILTVSDLALRLKKDLPQTERTQSVKPTCIIDSILYKNWNLTTNSLTISSKEEYGYNPQYNVFIKKRYSFNSFNQSWSYYYKTNLSYDNHDNLLNEASFSSSMPGSNPVWNNSGNNTYTYDNNNNRISSTTQYWNSQTNTWKTNSINTCTYNSNNLITQEIYQSASSFTAPLTNSYKYTYAYDIFNNPLLFQGYNWNPTTNAWENSEKYNITTFGNKITSYLGYEWDSATSSWINAYKGSMTYDANGNQTSQTEQSWNPNTNSWENEFKSTFTYDSNHNELSEINQNWDASSNTWVNENQSLYTYNVNNYVTSVTQKSWDISTNSWKNNYETDTYYNCHSVGLAEERPNASKLLIYPNPAQSELYIKSDREFNQVSILNVSGQLVFESNATELLNISSLVKGIYFIQLLDKNKTIVHTQKLVKE